jgi:hypothetical protein
MTDPIPPDRNALLPIDAILHASAGAAVRAGAGGRIN